jgi:sulfatase modifying factor 1
MKFSYRFLSLVPVAWISLGTPSFAAVNIEWVTVGNAGNAADPATDYGSVNYEYQISKYETTNAQYAEFLNANAATDTYGLYSTNMSSWGITRTGTSGSYGYSVAGGWENRPVNYVSWFDAARFVNWLTNGQGNGSTETGSYTLNGAISGTFNANVGATIYIPTENEWYKAAYYNGPEGNYSLYPNGQNSITTAEANFANIVGTTTDVGSYSSIASSYGTFDQAGNVYEWFSNGDHVHGYRGGSWGHTPSESGDYLSSMYALNSDPANQSSGVGFRLAASIPEPSASAFLGLAFGVVLSRRERQLHR